MLLRRAGHAAVWTTGHSICETMQNRQDPGATAMWRPRVKSLLSCLSTEPWTTSMTGPQTLTRVTLDRGYQFNDWRVLPSAHGRYQRAQHLRAPSAMTMSVGPSGMCQTLMALQRATASTLPASSACWAHQQGVYGAHQGAGAVETKLCVQGAEQLDSQWQG